MLKKQNRLSEITKTRENKLFTSPLFNIRISNSKEDQPRFAFIVSKKIDKRAVIRNQTRRVLSSAVGEIISELEMGKDIVVISKKALIPEQKEGIVKILQEIFKKAGIYK